MDSLSAGDLTIEVTRGTGGDIRCVWRGKSGERQPGKILAPFFDDVLGAARESSAAIAMHFEHLEHFNSSTITALIRLIQAARKQQLTLRMVYDQELKWQRLSFDALRVFEKADELFQLVASVADDVSSSTTDSGAR